MSTLRQLRERSAPVGAAASKRAAAAVQGVRRKLAPVMLALSGLGCLSYAAFTWHPWAGFVASGVSCFVLEWRVAE